MTDQPANDDEPSLDELLEGAARSMLDIARDGQVAAPDRVKAFDAASKYLQTRAKSAPPVRPAFLDLQDRARGAKK